MILTPRLGAFLGLPAIPALVLHTPQALITPGANSSLKLGFSTLGWNHTAIMKQSTPDGTYIHCETGAGHQYGNPDLTSCTDALVNIPQSTDYPIFSNREAEIRGASGLPYRFISCKPQLCAALTCKGPVNESHI